MVRRLSGNPDLSGVVNFPLGSGDNPKSKPETPRKGGTMQRIRPFPRDDEGLHDHHDPGRLHRHH